MNKYKLHLAAITKLVSHPEHLVLFPPSGQGDAGYRLSLPPGGTRAWFSDRIDGLDNTLKVKNLT